MSKEERKKSHILRDIIIGDSDKYSIIYSDSNTHAAIFLIFFLISSASKRFCIPVLFRQSLQTHFYDKTAFLYSFLKVYSFYHIFCKFHSATFLDFRFGRGACNSVCPIYTTVIVCCKVN
jgi:hypothetical protein